MRTNWGIKLVGNGVAFVPYRRVHVPKYHEWMKDPFLLEMTASEPLSIAEEFEMQASWRDDAKKCTFIVLDVSGLTEEEKMNVGSSNVEYMVGDVNLFLNDDEDPHCGEIELMIAEQDRRGKGLGKETLLLFVSYVYQALGIRKIVAKIGEKNDSSKALFEKVGFQLETFCDVFKEYTLILELNETGLPWLSSTKLNILEDLDPEKSPYENCDIVDQYMALHFGQAPEIVDETVRPHVGRPDGALNFPKRCADLVNEYAKIKGRALDLGCAVGGSSFELTKTFKQVIGIDNSASFIAQAKAIAYNSAPIEFSVAVEGNTKKQVTITLDDKVSRARVEFQTGDACNLPPASELGGLFDAILMGNLLCRVPDPEKCLVGLNKLLKVGGIVVIVSPYSWLPEYTNVAKWLVPGNTRIQEILQREGFTLVSAQDMPVMIREHERKYHYIISDALVFEKTIH